MFRFPALGDICPEDKSQYYFLYVTLFLILSALIALYFPGLKEPAYANVQTWMSVAATVNYALGSILCVQTKLLLILGMLGVGVCLYMGVEIYHALHPQYRELYQVVT